MLCKEIKSINEEKFFSRISIEDNGCWEYSGARDNSGYGCCYHWENKKTVKYLAHRVSYTIFVGELNTSMVLDHICKNRLCVNPNHLREVEFKVNVLENSNGVSAINKIKLSCPRGHTYDGLNTNGSRYCKECKKIFSKEYKQKRRKAKDGGLL